MKEVDYFVASSSHLRDLARQQEGDKRSSMKTTYFTWNGNKINLHLSKYKQHTLLLFMNNNILLYNNFIRNSACCFRMFKLIY